MSAFILTVFSAYADDIVFVANKNVCVDSLTKDEVRKIFLGKISMWPDNSPIRFVIVQQVDTHKRFVEKYANKTEEQFWAWWKRKLFTGSGTVPIRFVSEADVLIYVANTPGGIGYISSNVKIGDNVKVLHVSDNEGKGTK